MFKTLCLVFSQKTAVKKKITRIFLILWTIDATTIPIAQKELRFWNQLKFSNSTLQPDGVQTFDISNLDYLI